MVNCSLLVEYSMAFLPQESALLRSLLNIYAFRHAGNVNIKLTVSDHHISSQIT